MELELHVSQNTTAFTPYLELTSVLLSTLTQPTDLLAAHFHNTYDRAIPNLVVALSKGISVVDSSVAGIGGCPYAKGASGNVATEDVLYLLELLGIEHGVDFAKLREAGEFISGELKRENLSSVTDEDLKLIPERRQEIKQLLN